jgi:hypothetical protein
MLALVLITARDFDHLAAIYFPAGYAPWKRQASLLLPPNHTLNAARIATYPVTLLEDPTLAQILGLFLGRRHGTLPTVSRFGVHSIFEPAELRRSLSITF